MRVVSILLVAGCAERVELDGVPLVGGTPEQREAARDTIRAFDEAAGPGRLQLVEVAFEPLTGSRVGQYDRDRIQLDEELDPSEVPFTVRHELCHALDDAEGLLDDAVSAFDRAGSRLPDAGDDRQRRSEVLAEWCEMGGGYIQALETACPGDPPFAAELSAFVARHVWPERERMPVVALGEAHATARIEVPFEWFNVYPTADPDVVEIDAFNGDGFAMLAYHLDTGERAPYADTADDAMVGSVLGWEEGPAATYLWYFTLGKLGPVAPRVAVRSADDDWALVSDCLDESARLFTARDQVWLAWADGDTVSWTPLGR